MTDAENLAILYESLGQAEEEIRNPAEYQLKELRKTNLAGFIGMNLEILSNAENFPPIALQSSLVYLRISFKKATKAKQLNDLTKQYLFIPLELVEEFLPIVFNLLSNESLYFLAANLLGQISAYILSFDPENQILSTICQELPNQNVTIPCCIAIEYLFQEFDVSLQLQSIILPTIVPLLSDDNVSDEIKSKLIAVITSMILSLPSFLGDNVQEFAQSMLSLTSSDALKQSLYMFWNDAANYLPSIFEFVPDITEVSFNDLQSFLDEENQDNDPEILMTILQFWCNLGNQEHKNPGTLAELLAPAIPALFPPFLSIFQSLNPDSLDSNDDWDPHIAARDSILALSSALPEQSIPVLLEFAEQAMESLGSNPSSVLKETILFSFSAILDSYEDDNDEQNENNEQIKNIASQCIQLVSQCLSETEDPNNSLRVISQSLKLLLSIIQNEPEIYDYSEFVEFLMGCIQETSNCLCEDSKDVLSEIISLPALKGNLAPIFESLLSYDNIPSLDLALTIAKNELSPDFSNHYISQLIALAEVYAGDEVPESGENLLPFAIQMIIFLVDELGEAAVPYSRAIFQLMKQIYDFYHHPEALKAICSIVHITNQNVVYAVNLVIKELQNSIFIEENADESNPVEQSSYQMRLTAINSISLYLSRCDVQQYFHELMRILLALLELQQDDENVKELDSDLKTDTLEAINSLHIAFPPLMLPFVERLIPIYEAGLNYISMVRNPEPGNQIFEDEDEKEVIRLNSVILEGLKLLLMNEIEELAAPTLQLALAAIQIAVDSPTIDKQCMCELIDLLSVMIKLTPDDTKNFISTNEELKQLIEESKEDEDLNKAINTMMSLIQ